MKADEMICFDRVSFRYGESGQGVTDINLTIKTGECVVLTGTSGCGKTTLTRLVDGLAPGYYPGKLTGQINLNGKDISTFPTWKIGSIVGSIFQNPKSQFFASDLFGEVAFACENYGYEQEEIQKRTLGAIEKMKLSQLADRPLDVISSGEMQKVAIASVYALSPQIFVFDEPTANLDAKGIDLLREIVKLLKQDGHTLVIAEHRLFWLKDLADRFVYMNDGKIENIFDRNSFLALPEEDRNGMGLRRLTEVAGDKTDTPVFGEEILLAKGLSKRKGKHIIFHDVDLALSKGEVVAFTGENGKGKTTLATVLSGLSGRNAGDILLHGRPATKKALRNAIYYCSNQTGTQFFTPGVTEELLLNVKQDEETLERARTLLRQFDLYQYKDVHPAALSGGQKLRLAVAIALFSGKGILILDEPTSGLDGRNMRLIAQALKDAAEEGRSALVITHDRELIGQCCDREIALP